MDVNCQKIMVMDITHISNILICVLSVDKKYSGKIRIYEEAKEGTKMRCKNYVCIACVDGTCPKANIEEYEERCIPTVSKCDECFYYKGCEGCDLYGTEYCNKN